MTLIAVLAALLAYLAAAVVHGREQWAGAADELTGDEALVIPPMARGLALGGVVLHAVALVGTAVMSTTMPGFAESLSAVSLGVMVAYVFVARDNLAPLGRFLLPAGLALVLVSLAVPSPKVAALSDTTASWWLPVHLGLVFAGVASFFVEFFVSLAQSFVRRRLKAKQFRGLERLPSLEVLDRVQLRALSFGLVCLGLGVGAGVFWAANVMHHADWAANPKVWSTALIWCWYAGALVVRQFAGFHSRAAMTLSWLGFAGLMFSVFGLDFVTGGFHAYGQ